MKPGHHCGEERAIHKMTSKITSLSLTSTLPVVCAQLSLIQGSRCTLQLPQYIVEVSVVSMVSTAEAFYLDIAWEGVQENRLYIQAQGVGVERG